MFPLALLSSLLSSRSALRSRRSQYVLSPVALGTAVSQGKTGQSRLGDGWHLCKVLCSLCQKHP